MDQSNQQMGWMSGNLAVALMIIAVFVPIFIAIANMLGVSFMDVANQFVNGLKP